MLHRHQESVIGAGRPRRASCSGSFVRASWPRVRIARSNNRRRRPSWCRFASPLVVVPPGPVATGLLGRSARAAACGAAPLRVGAPLLALRLRLRIVLPRLLPLGALLLRRARTVPSLVGHVFPRSRVSSRDPRGGPASPRAHPRGRRNSRPTRRCTCRRRRAIRRDRSNSRCRWPRRSRCPP